MACPVCSKRNVQRNIERNIYVEITHPTARGRELDTVDIERVHSCNPLDFLSEHTDQVITRGQWSDEWAAAGGIPTQRGVAYAQRLTKAARP